MNFSSAVGLFVEDDRENDEETINYRNERKLRERYNVMDIPNKKFQETFRLSKTVFAEILEEIKGEFTIDNVSSRITKVPLCSKLSSVLNFYATGSYQRTIGDVMLHSMDQSMVSRSIDEITCVLERKLCPKWITFPNEQEKAKQKRMFYEKVKIPGIIGCIDGTHVDMIAPAENEHLFVDRRGQHSLNVQLICSNDLRIWAVSARFPGSTHDSAIWCMSAEKRRLENDYENGERNTWLLGDSGYPLQKWLITPFKTPSTEEERKFNYVHAQGRNAIESCNGVLKGTFRCLLGERKLMYEPLKVVRIVYVCCALLNICISKNLEILEQQPDEGDTQEEMYREEDDSDSDSENYDDETAIEIRQRLMNTLI